MFGPWRSWLDETSLKPEAEGAYLVRVCSPNLFDIRESAVAPEFQSAALIQASDGIFGVSTGRLLHHDPHRRRLLCSGVRPRPQVSPFPIFPPLPLLQVQGDWWSEDRQAAEARPPRNRKPRRFSRRLQDGMESRNSCSLALWTWNNMSPMSIAFLAAGVGREEWSEDGKGQDCCPMQVRSQHLAAISA